MPEWETIRECQTRLHPILTRTTNHTQTQPEQQESVELQPPTPEARPQLALTHLLARSLALPPSLPPSRTHSLAHTRIHTICCSWLKRYTFAARRQSQTGSKASRQGQRADRESAGSNGRRSTECNARRGTKYRPKRRPSCRRPSAAAAGRNIL